MLFLESQLLKRHGVVHGFSVRQGGVSAAPYDSLNLGGAVGDQPESVARNLRLLTEAAGIESLATVHQVHGDRVVFAPLSGRVEADAIVVEGGGSAGVRTADCVPILIHDPHSGASAAVHAGWRGTVAHIVIRAVEALTSTFDAKPAQLLAAIGPAIGPCCFEVGAEVAARFASDARMGEGTVSGSRVDLFRANRQLLLSAGLPAAHIDVLERCTSCEPALFFSHRRDRGVTGRHLSFIASRSPQGPR